MNHVLATLIHDQAARDAQMVRPGRSLPALLSFACPAHPAQEIRERYRTHLRRAQIGGFAREAAGMLARYREEMTS